MEHGGAGGGIGFLGALCLLFIGLKLGGVIHWPWLWVLGPVWIPAAVALTMVALFLLAAGLFFAVGGVIRMTGR